MPFLSLLRSAVAGDDAPVGLEQARVTVVASGPGRLRWLRERVWESRDGIATRVANLAGLHGLALSETELSVGRYRCINQASCSGIAITMLGRASRFEITPDICWLSLSLETSGRRGGTWMEAGLFVNAEACSRQATLRSEQLPTFRWEAPLEKVISVAFEALWRELERQGPCPG